jgi:septal ring factor EnvC (AmiA/AmiB activator)
MYKSSSISSSFLRRIIFSCCAVCLSFSLSTVVSGETIVERNVEKTQITQGIKKYRINIRRLKQGIKRQQEQVRQTREQERNLLAELQDIDTRLLEQKEKLDVLEARMQAQEELIVVKKRELDRARQEKKAVQEHLQKRIQAYYKTGDIGFINVAFSTKTLPELLQIHDSFQTLITYDRQVVETFRHTIDQLVRSIESFKLEEGMLKEFISQNLQEKEKIGFIRQEKEILLARIRTQSKLHEQAIIEMEQASSSLSSHIQVLEKKEDFIDQSFLRNKGELPPPITGDVVSRFQEQTTNRLGISALSKGIAIDAPTGTIVKAVHEGFVVFSGYLRGYGNTIIVNHGYQYYSITSRVERLLVKKDVKVNEKTDIGIMGDTATLMSEGLYFEIRRGSENLDPLLWLDTSGLGLDEKMPSPPNP